jgi:hypothetical protein
MWIHNFFKHCTFITTHLCKWTLKKINFHSNHLTMPLIPSFPMNVFEHTIKGKTISQWATCFSLSYVICSLRYLFEPTSSIKTLNLASANMELWQSPPRNNFFLLVIKTFHSLHKRNPYCSLLAPTNLFWSLQPFNIYIYIGNMFFYFNPKDAKSSIIN